ncbi:hypothetical protein QMZ92_30450 [Streptomyces sp. HNM0645]|uniref:hypothetical protein n=1 Tax=Streptomyces sp. HNM0645 TaxID=2782343 RepID=UPI0024B82FA3|nr:hypothetical protein [Streptomyces sp. HNM0645]MDI9888573.1 hypothetical protein [Streptomyces sp. HNM0645]
MTAHAAIVVLTAALIGEIAGFLTSPGTRSIDTAVLTGVTTAGIGAPVLSKAIGR